MQYKISVRELCFLLEQETFLTEGIGVDGQIKNQWKMDYMVCGFETVGYL